MTPKTTLPCHDHWVLALAWSPDGTRLASGSKDGKLCIYHQGPSVFQLQFQLHHHKGAITSLCWEPYHLNPTTSRVCSGGHDGTLRIWNSSGHCDWVLSQHTKPITCVKWGGEGHLYSASRDGSIKVWSSIDGRLLYTLSGHGHWVNTMALSTDLIIRLGPYPSPPTASSSLSSRNKLTVDEVKQRYLEHRGPTERLVSGSDDFTLHLWTGNVKKLRLPGHQGLVNQVSFSKLGDLIVSASFDKSIKLWHGHSGECLATFLGHVGAVYQLMFSPDTRWIVSCSKDGTCKVWELATRKLKVDLPGHRDEIYAVDWSPSGDFVCSGGKDRVLKIWRY
ncbi:Notchless protein 1 [Coelomomyces lativittatus]|nr:Notchless protein 1 [Coelomomyces lativittatus]